MYRRTSVWLGVFFLLFGLESPALAADEKACREVLELTGREQVYRFSKTLKEEWSKTSTYSSQVEDAGGVVGDFAGDWSDESTSSFDNETYKQWRRTFVEDLDQVYGPAVKAWLECRNSDSVVFMPKRTNSERIIAEFRAGEGKRPLLNSITFDDSVATCTADDRSVRSGRRLNKALDQTSFNVTCTRSANDEDGDAIEIVVNTSGPTFFLDIQRVIPESKFDPNNAKNVTYQLGGCEKFIQLPVADYDRELFFKDFSMTAGGASGEAIVSINGTRLFNSPGRERDEHDTKWPSDPVPQYYYTALAGLPHAIAVSNVINTTTQRRCYETHGTVSYTPLTD